MYNIQTVSERIKLDARQQGIKLKEMLESCGLNVNFISQMSDRTGAFALAKIADYLNCSVDYLLGRTDNPSATGGAYINGDNNNNGQQAINGNVTVNNAADKKDTLTEQFIQKFEQLDFDDKVDVMQYVKNKK